MNRGTVALVAGNRFQLTASATLDGTPKSAAYNLTVTALANGAYYLANAATLEYADILDPVASGTSVLQESYSGESTQRWIFSHIGSGYYTIRSANNSNYYLGVEDDSQYTYAEIVLRTGTITDGMKWKIVPTSKFTYKIVSKLGEANNQALWGGFAYTIIAQRPYTSDNNYEDEWYIEPQKFYFATVNPYYDHSYHVGYNESEYQSRTNIAQYTDAVADRFHDLFGLLITVGTPTYYASPLDICKGTVTTSNISTLCQHSTLFPTLHDHFSSQFPFDSQTTNVYWSLHAIRTATDSQELNRCYSANRQVYMIERQTYNRTLWSESILMHELGHQYGAPDHYHDDPTESSDGKCCNYPKCSECGDSSKRPEQCVMNLCRMDISEAYVFCSFCRQDILAFLERNFTP